MDVFLVFFSFCISAPTLVLPHAPLEICLSATRPCFFLSPLLSSFYHFLRFTYPFASKRETEFFPLILFWAVSFFEYSKLMKKVFKMWRGSDCLCSCPITNRMNISNQKTYNICKQLYSAILTKIILLFLCVLSMGFLMRHDETFMVALEISQYGRMGGHHHL